MTDKLEKQFFDTFGIEPKRGVELTIDATTDDNVMNEHNVCYGYPQITDRILLELICLWNSACTHTEDCIIPVNYQTAKQYTLNHFIDIENYRFEVEEIIIKHQVQALFEEG